MAFTDDGPLHDWTRLDEEGLRAYAAAHVGWATDEMADPADLRWTLDDVPLDLFTALPIEWDRWHAEEVAPNPRCAWMAGGAPFHTPVVVSVEAGEPIVWDGWHRIAEAFHRGDATIAAVLGREGSA